MRRLVEHKIDRPNTQCKLIARMRKTYFQLNILRRNCAKKYGKNQVRQDVKKALKAKKEARAIKQAQREEKKRNKRGKNFIFCIGMTRVGMKIFGITPRRKVFQFLANISCRP